MTDNMRGAVFMTLAMAGFALEDMALKAAAAHIPIGQAVLMLGGAGTVVFALAATAQGDAILPRSFANKVLLIRSAFEICGRVFYALAIALTPLSSASAILQATPLVVALGAVIVFGEKVGWRRWLAIIVGFCGVLMILRPGLDSFNPLSVLAVLGMLGFAGRDLATRASPLTMSSAQLGVAGFLVLTLAGVVLTIWAGNIAAPTPGVWMYIGLATAAGVLAYAALTMAMRTGEVSVVTPLRYTRLLFGLALGVLVFSERPDALTLWGGGVIVLSGLFLLSRGRKPA